MSNIIALSNDVPEELFNVKAFVAGIKKPVTDAKALVPEAEAVGSGAEAVIKEAERKGGADMVPIIGSVVCYTLTKEDAASINRRRTSSTATAERIENNGDELASHTNFPDTWPTGNEVFEGQICPAIVIRVWDIIPGPCYDVQVRLDGYSVHLWASGRLSNEPKAGMCHWPTIR